MKLFSVIVFTCAVLSAQAQNDPCNPHCEGCEESTDIGKITCAGGNSDCEIADNGELDLDYLLKDEDETPIKAIDAKACRSKCQQQADKAVEDDAGDSECKFFRWVDAHDGASNCSLQTTCGPADDTCERPGCITGELGCTDDGVRIHNCPLNVADWNHDKFHIMCFHKSDEGNLDINIYKADDPAPANGADKDIPGGTICHTVKKCSEWKELDAEIKEPYYRMLAIYCDITDKTWKKMEKTGHDVKSQEMADQANGVTKKIEEPTCCLRTGEDEIDAAIDAIQGCKCEVTTTNIQPWGDLICENPLEGSKVKDPNFCMLLCDNHLTTSFDDKINEEGEKEWIDQDGGKVNDDNLKC